MPTSPRRFRIMFRADRVVRPYTRPPYPRLALTLSFRASDRCHWRGNPFPFSCRRRPLAATYLCRFAAKARFDNRHPREGVSKEGGPQPSLFGRFKGKRFLRKGGNRNPPFLKPFFGYFLSGKKVTRRRQKRKGQKESTPRSAKKERGSGRTESSAPTL